MKIYKHKGFTLLEIMITMAILSVLLASIFQTQSEITQVLFHSSNRKSAQNYVQSKIIEKVTGQSKKDKLGERQGIFPEESPMHHFKWSEKVERDQLFTIPVLKTTIKLTWSEGNAERSYQSIVFSQSDNVVQN